ncbi:predicted protein [Histoplasma capsulatum H143]|uniref:Uncharacterized protein n=1 Tax=Ajellomyces capsulatus (strain H143) TaxID=544712 RepID=C6HCE8_AJECH|nr:predicted protein [Histoplasma capsulatum H143]
MSNASSATPARHCIAKRAFGSRKLCRQSPATAEYIYVALALDAATPLIIIDGNLTDPGNPACHHRQIWTGNFNPLAHKILLNKELVEDMVDAAGSQHIYRRFQFQFVNVFFHETGGHLLFTYLYHGLPSTLRQVIPPTWRGQGAEEDIGESGRTLETVVLGATLEFFDVPKARLNTVDRGPQQERKKSYKTDD